jgi:KUP system potassium uptake protein
MPDASNVAVMTDSTLQAAGSGAPPRWAALSALGVVFGDLGTSPLYTLQTVVQALGGQFAPPDAIGVLSLVTWTLLLTVSIKYGIFVLRADNRGEGGILALMSLLGANGFERGVRVLTGMGLVGAALIYGDGVITPAISVLSALEGLNEITSAFKPYVMPMAVAILLCLFAAQRFGTEKIGRAFGPVMLLWFATIAALGVRGILLHPRVLVALDPQHAVHFMMHSHRAGFLVLGGVFLCITGGEALYADLGHFGRGAIRKAWYGLVLPALLLSYAGQTAFLLDAQDVSGNPFFRLAPAWSLYPLVLLATLATVIASQAVITGSFSMTRQAMQLGWLPGVNIRQTSDRIYGQIYVPVVNWLLMIATIAITVGFQSSDRLAGAYGTAVSTTMLLTTVLLHRAMRDLWHWPAALAFLVAGAFLTVDLSFFVANVLKIAEGGWLPLSLAAALFLLMVTWRKGVDAVRATLQQSDAAADEFVRELKEGRILRTEGTTVFLTRSTQKVSRLIIDHARFVGVLPRNAIALSIVFENTPRITGPRCTVVENVGAGLWHMEARFGFFEIPDLKQALKRAHGIAGVNFDAAQFVGTRDLIVHKQRDASLRGWRIALFAFLYRNSVKLVDRFNLEPARVVEIARQIEI